MTTIYALVDPRTFVVRYIGRTATSPEQRSRRHMSQPGKTPVGKWCRELKQAGLVPKVRVLETCNSDVAHLRESYWIRRRKNPSLLNVQDYSPPIPAVSMSRADILRVMERAGAASRDVRDYLLGRPMVRGRGLQRIRVIEAIKELGL